MVLLFGDAILQLGGRGLGTIRAGFTPLEWLALAAVTALFLYGEGERALARRWVPNMLDRVREVGAERRPGIRLLAPLYVLSLLAAPRRTLVRAWAGGFLIVLAVLIVRALPEPWRGIIDFAVAAALARGLVAMLLQGYRRVRGGA